MYYLSISMESGREKVWDNDVAKLFASLDEYINKARNNIDQYELAAQKIKPNFDYKDKL